MYVTSDCVRTSAHTCFSPIQSTVYVEPNVSNCTMKNPLRNLFRRGKSTSGSATPVANSMTPSAPSQASFPRPTARLPSPELPNALAQSTPTPPILNNLFTNQPSAPTCTSSPASPPHTTLITDNPPHILAAMPLAGADYLDASHSVFNSAGRDIYNTHNYQLISGACSLIVDLKL
jgi:hypothetical protein